jgi:hypothetical protein
MTMNGDSFPTAGDTRRSGARHGGVGNGRLDHPDGSVRWPESEASDRADLGLPHPTPESEPDPEWAETASRVITDPGGNTPKGVSMDLVSLVRLLARRWRVTVPAAMLTLVGVVAAFQLSAPTYESTGSIVLLNPPGADQTVPGAAGGDPTDVNPYARFNDLSVVADIMAREVRVEPSKSALARQGVAKYEVTANEFSNGPVIDVTGDGASPEEAIRSAELVLAEVQNALLHRQQSEGADPKYFISSTPVEPPVSATAQYGSTIRAAIGALALGMLGTVALGVVADAIAHRRQRSRPTTTEPVVPSVTNGPADTTPTNGRANTDRAVATGIRRMSTPKAAQLVSTEPPTDEARIRPVADGRQ